jgi:hypothetical protein
VINDIWPFLAVFVMTLITEWCWARYNIASARRLPLPSALWSAGIVLVGNLSLTLWFENHWTICASVLASLIGTYYAVKYHKAEDAQEKVE